MILRLELLIDTYSLSIYLNGSGKPIALKIRSFAHPVSAPRALPLCVLYIQQ